MIVSSATNDLANDGRFVRLNKIFNRARSESVLRRRRQRDGLAQRFPIGGAARIERDPRPGFFSFQLGPATRHDPDDEARRIAPAGLVAAIPCAVISSSFCLPPNKKKKKKNIDLLLAASEVGILISRLFQREPSTERKEKNCCCCCVATGEDGIRSQVFMQKKRGEEKVSTRPTGGNGSKLRVSLPKGSVTRQ